MSKLCWILTALFTLSASQSARAAEPTDSELAAEFGARVRPFLKTYCEGCHGKEKAAAKLDLSAQTSVQAVRELHQTWEAVLERLEDKEMPPADAQSQPTLAERTAVVDWIRNFRAAEARRQAGDPGIVLARRLSTAEYDNTIRDLTGVDLRPSREFPVDPANEAGFDNSGESLTISPALLKKYLAAARGVADHLVVGPAGLAFAPHPVVTETDRDKYCVQRIVDFYHQHKVDYADYFEAAWRFQHWHRLGQGDATLDSVAAEHRLSAKYLTLVWELLTDKSESAGPLLALREMWQALPPPESAASPAPRGECERLRDTVLKFRQEITPKVERLKEPGISQGSQPLLLWRNRELAKRRLGSTGINREKLTPPDGPAERTAYEAALERYCRVFPDALTITDRKPYFDEQGQLSGRLLTAGFHLMQGYFRDDTPLYELVLTDDERRELDRLWLELNFITRAPQRQYKDFIFFERAEPPRTMQEARFDFARAEDKDSV